MSVAVVNVRGVEVPVEFEIFNFMGLASFESPVEQVEWFPADQEQFNRLFGTLTIAEQEDVEDQLFRIQAERDELDAMKYVDA